MLGTYSRSCTPHRFDEILLIPLTKSPLEPAAVILPVLFSEHGMTMGSAKVNIPRGNAEETYTIKLGDTSLGCSTYLAAFTVSLVVAVTCKGPESLC
jgi:hypothetical protein